MDSFKNIVLGGENGEILLDRLLRSGAEGHLNIRR